MKIFDERQDVCPRCEDTEAGERLELQQAASARRLPPPLTKIEADFESGLMREIHHENPGVNLEICRMYARRMIEAKRQYQAQAPAWVSQSR